LKITSTVGKQSRRIARGVGRRFYRLIMPKESDISRLYTQAAPKGNRIPNVVYQTWKIPRLPSLHALGVKRFRKLNPDYGFSFFDDKAMDDYMTGNYAGHPILDVYKAIWVPAMRADIWRYCVLFREGGIYCDIDSALSIPFRELLSENPSEMLSFEGNKWADNLELGKYADPAIFLDGPSPAARKKLDFPENAVLNWLLCFEKGHSILGELIDLIVLHFGFFKDKVFPSVHQVGVHCTGTEALTQAVWMWADKADRRPAQCGIDFKGHGLYKLDDSDARYALSPRFSSFSNTSVTKK